jgi:ATP-dependent phosphofructokinase / diphosphate-dependent phosphofructokinase
MHTMKREAVRSGKLVIAEGGGPTAVINQSLAGAVLEARLFPQIERVYGARYGVRGIVNEDFVDLSAETHANLEAVAATPSSALGSTRDKPDLAYCRNIPRIAEGPQRRLVPRRGPPACAAAPLPRC